MNPLIQSKIEEMKFDRFADAIATAEFIETILNSEHAWIINRLSWLYLFQSFCLTAYSILLATPSFCAPSTYQGLILKIGLPIIGIGSCMAVGIAVNAAKKVVRHVANERAKLTHYINVHAGISIPLIGVDHDYRQANIRGTAWQGALPELLTWVIIVLWIVLVIATLITR
jgi:hypothetical protein